MEMVRFFDYLYYRIATSSYYQKTAHQYAYIYAYGLVSLLEGFNILTIIKLFSIFLNIEIKTTVILIFCCIPLVIINTCRLNERRLAQLKETYKEETSRRKNGYIIIIYLLVTVVLFFCVLVFSNII